MPEAGDVEHRVDPSERVDGRREHRFHVGLVAHVNAMRHDGVAERGCGVLLLPADVGGENLGAFAHEHFRRGAAHA